jgi:hypothetical protein
MTQAGVSKIDPTYKDETTSFGYTRGKPVKYREHWWQFWRKKPKRVKFTSQINPLNQVLIEQTVWECEGCGAKKWEKLTAYKLCEVVQKCEDCAPRIDPYKHIGTRISDTEIMIGKPKTTYRHD